jgi:hypothetical protein
MVPRPAKPPALDFVLSQGPLSVHWYLNADIDRNSDCLRATMMAVCLHLAKMMRKNQLGLPEVHLAQFDSD